VVLGENNGGNHVFASQGPACPNGQGDSGLAFLRSGANFRVDSAAFIAAAFFGVLAVGIPAILIRERRLAADERLSRELDLAGLSVVLTEVSETPPR
jgi:hypothetical protein